MDLTLLILAAGMGSRYGGLKQLEPLGPAGQTLMDYSVRDAAAAGFQRVIFVIRRDFADDFQRQILPRYDFLQTAVVFQDLADLPAGCTAPAERVKPWGTGHAIWCAREAISTPFLAINADDFYGADSFRVLAEHLQNSHPAGECLPCALAGYALQNTLSSHGGVSRGICSLGADGLLEKVEEHTDLRLHPDGTLTGLNSAGELCHFSGQELVSMNFWGFPPSIFPALEALFLEFLQNEGGKDPKAEFYIPSAVTNLIENGKAEVTVLPTQAQWFGVTYQADRAAVVAALQRLES